MVVQADLDRKTVLELLNLAEKTDLRSENEGRPWDYARFKLIDRPLMRVWDKFSGSQPDPDGDFMLSRAPRQRLDNYESREKSLATHANHRRWELTPYISFTDSPAGLRQLAADRTRRRRGFQTLTVIDTYSRIDDILPVLNFAEEMEYYDIEDPYGKSNRYYNDQYLCVWEVKKRDIVGHWAWDELEKNDEWYDEIIHPVWKAHREKASALSNARHETLSSPDYFEAVSLTGDASSSRVSLNPEYLFPTNVCCSSDEESIYHSGNDLDDDTDDGFEDERGENTDDEVEEANAADDVIKIIEGDW